MTETVNAQAEALLALGGFRARDGTVLIAEVGPDVVGVAVLRLCDGEAEVLALLTAPNHRHRGVARALVHEMSKRAKAAGCQRLRVRVDKARDDVPAFFRALGSTSRSSRSTCGCENRALQIAKGLAFTR